MTDIRPSNVARRRAAERRFRFYGAAAMTLTAAFLVSLIADIVIKAIPAFHEHRVVLQVLLDPAAIDAANPRAGDYDSLIRKAFRGLFPSVTTRGERKALSALLSKGAADDLRTMVAADPGLIGQTVGVPALLSDDADLYLEGSDTAMTTVKRGGALQVHQSKDIYRLTGDTSRLAPGMIVRINGGALRIVSGETDGMQAEALIPQLGRAQDPQSTRAHNMRYRSDLDEPSPAPTAVSRSCGTRSTIARSPSRKAAASASGSRRSISAQCPPARTSA